MRAFNRFRMHQLDEPLEGGDDGGNTEFTPGELPLTLVSCTTPETVSVDESVTVTATIRNDGSHQITATPVLTSQFREVATGVSLVFTPGREREVTFTFQPSTLQEIRNAPRNRAQEDVRLTVKATQFLTGETVLSARCTRLTVEIGRQTVPGTVAVSNCSLSKTRVSPGTNVTVTATVTNRTGNPVTVRPRALYGAADAGTGNRVRVPADDSTQLNVSFTPDQVQGIPRGVDNPTIARSVTLVVEHAGSPLATETVEEITCGDLTVTIPRRFREEPSDEQPPQTREPRDGRRRQPSQRGTTLLFAGVGAVAILIIALSQG